MSDRYDGLQEIIDEALESMAAKPSASLTRREVAASGFAPGRASPARWTGDHQPIPVAPVELADVARHVLHGCVEVVLVASRGEELAEAGVATGPLLNASRP